MLLIFALGVFVGGTVGLVIGGWLAAHFMRDVRRAWAGGLTALVDELKLKARGALDDAARLLQERAAKVELPPALPPPSDIVKDAIEALEQATETEHWVALELLTGKSWTWKATKIPPFLNAVEIHQAHEEQTKKYVSRAIEHAEAATGVLARLKTYRDAK